MKIVVLDRPREYPDEIDWSRLYKIGSVAMYERTPPELVIERIGDAQIVFTNKAAITSDVLNACPNIRFISVIGTGYNTIDVNTATARGIPVSNVPDYGAEAIGQHAIALLLEITNHVAHHDNEVRKGRRNSDKDWCFWDYPIIELTHKTIGIIGLGRIGRITSRIAQALGMNVLAYDSHIDSTLQGEFLRYTDLETLLAKSDVIALHCPLFPETKEIINKSTIHKMKNGVILLNNSRGELIVEQDLADALNSGKVFAAGLDTVSNEPIDMSSPLLSARNCFITPHISWAAIECRQRLKDTAIDNTIKFLAGTPINIVNPII